MLQISFFTVVTVVIRPNLLLNVHDPIVLYRFLGRSDPIVLLNARVRLCWLRFSSLVAILFIYLLFFCYLFAILLYWFMNILNSSIFCVVPFLSDSALFRSDFLAAGFLFSFHTICILGRQQSYSHSFRLFRVFLIGDLFIQCLSVLFDRKFYVIVNWNFNCSSVFYLFFRVMKLFQKWMLKSLLCSVSQAWIEGQQVLKQIQCLWINIAEKRSKRFLFSNVYLIQAFKSHERLN